MLSGKSLAEKGTLSQLKNSFRHRGVKHDIMNSFNDSDDFHRFVTEAHVALYVMEKCGMETFDGSPTDGLPGSRRTDSKEDKTEYVHQVATTLVDEVTKECMPSQAAINEVIEADIKDDPIVYCWCEMGKKFP